MSSSIRTWPGRPVMVHVWHCFAPMLPEADQALARIGEFVRGRMR